MKEKGYILGASNFVGKSRDGRDLDLGRVSLCTSNGAGGFTAAEYLYGRSADVIGVNKAVHQAGCPVPAEFEFSVERDFKTGNNVVRLKGFVILNK